MPRHQEPKKDGANTEMLRGAVSKHRAVDIRMGKPTYGEPYVSYTESIGIGGERGELKHLSTLRKRK